ncbi:MAG: argininosuccinate lyase [Pedobacter sp.]|nr:MAG: argininosuccinate lyase [Pedobacter sp.]
MKLWEKNTKIEKSVERFTIGKDHELDLQLASFDVLGSLAHTQMLQSIGLLTSDELKAIQQELKNIYKSIRDGHFTIADGVEDVHSQIELLLVKRIGETGKKIHSGRSRNDQVLVDLKLFFRYQIQQLVANIDTLFRQLIQQSEQHQDKLFPGYTHLQLAMPSSFGLWFGAYAESLSDDMHLLLAAWKICNKNPLGSAAGYGSSFPLNRSMTTQLLGFDSLNYNVVYAQMARGKTERIIAQAMASVAATLSKLAMDVCLFMNQNFAFVGFPDELTTGSSIMPHKKNPDVFELIRSRCNKIQALPNEIVLMTNNLPSGYHRDLQLLKESLFPAFESLNECLTMTAYMLQHIRIRLNILEDEQYAYLFSVEAVNKQVLQGVPFREAYHQVGLKIEKGEYLADTTLHHTHEGSIGNLCNQAISELFDITLSHFNFSEVEQVLQSLLKE